MLHAEKHPAKIDVEDPVPLLEIVISRRGRLLRLDARVIEREVEAPENFSGLVESGSHVFDLRNVATDGKRLSALFLDHAGGLLIGRLRHISYNDACTFASESQRSSSSNTSARAGYECDFP